METRSAKGGEQLYENVVKVRTKGKAHANGIAKQKSVCVLTDESDRRPLTRDQLAKYVDSPGWKLWRVSLLVLVWVVILGLTAGAIYLVAVDPTRTATNIFWWRHATYYQISVKSFQDSNSDGVGDLNGVLGRLDYIQGLGMQSIILNPVFSSRSGNSFAATDFTSIDRAVGTSEDFDALVKAVHERNMTIVMDIVVSQTDRAHAWFQTSETYPHQGIVSTGDHYVWHNGDWNNKLDHQGGPIPGLPSPLVGGFLPIAFQSTLEIFRYITKDFRQDSKVDLFYSLSHGMSKLEILSGWLSLGRESRCFLIIPRLRPNCRIPKTVQEGQPAWTWSESRHQYYRHLYASSSPDLNYANSEVRLAMDEVLRFWLRRGVDGFRYLKIKDMISTAEAALAPSNSSTLPAETMDVIRRWRRILDEPSNSPVYKKKVLIVQDDDLDRFQLHFAGVSHVMDTNLLQVDSTTTGWHLAALVEKVLTNLPQRATASWGFSDYNRHRAASRVGSLDLVDGLNMICLLLPGTCVSFYGDELGLKDGSNGLSLRREDATFLVRGPQLTPMPWSSGRIAGFTDYVAAWLPVQDNFRYTVQYQQRTSPSHLHLFEELVRLRNDSALVGNLYRAALITDTLYSFLRLNPDSTGYLVAVDLRKSGKEVVHYNFDSVDLGQNSRVADVVMASVNLYRTSRSSFLTAVNATVNLDESLPLRPGEAVVLRIPSAFAL